MNFRRGLFRIWVVVSGLWVVMMIILRYQDSSGPSFWQYAFITAIVPFAVLFLGYIGIWALTWIAEGFKRRRQSN